MHINEIQEKLNISTYTLRYYEKIGLIKPYRDENNYRVYTDQDIEMLKKIKFLREIDIPIEDIQKIIWGQCTFQDILENHMKKIDTQIQSLNYIKEICEDLKEKQIPILDAVTNDKIMVKENLDIKKIKNNLKNVSDYFKVKKTVIIGVRQHVRDYLSSIIAAIPWAIMCSLGITIGIPKSIEYVNKQNTAIHINTFQSNIKSFIICFLLCMIVLSIYFIYIFGYQNYIELTDNGILICDGNKHKRISIITNTILKKNNHYIKYDWNKLEKVNICLIFSLMGGARAGVYHIYVPKFIFKFYDGYVYEIEAGINCGEDLKTAYHILRNKDIEIVADEEMIDYFEQNELKCYDYFENIYHLNSSKK